MPPVEPQVLDRLRACAPSVRIKTVADPEDLPRFARGANAVYGYNSERFFRAAGDLEWVQSGSAGVESYPFELFRERSITLTNAKQIYGIQLADHTLALILAFSRQLPFLLRSQAEHRWESRDNFPPDELAGRRLLVVGLGGTGLEVARRASAFGMSVVATRRRHDISPPSFVDSVHPPDALVRALRAGRIAGAGLDVTDPEPLPPDHPLWDMEQVIITPHSAGHSPAAGRRMMDLLAENLSRWARGAELLNRVDLSLEY